MDPRRYSLASEVDFEHEVLPVNGSREGLFFATLPAVGRKELHGRPVILLPNPFYQAYLGGTYAADCEPVYLNATAETQYLPDLEALASEPEILRRTAALFRSPANPLAREYDFMLFVDGASRRFTSAPTPHGRIAGRSRDARALPQRDRVHLTRS